MTEKELIDLLKLEPLKPEGGYYRQTFKSDLSAPHHGADRALSTCIYYLLSQDSYSAFHRVTGTEIFHFYLGDPAEIFQIAADGSLDQQELGSDLLSGQRPQVIVPALHWQALRLKKKARLGWSLLGTTVSPGFEFADFELGRRKDLVTRYPAHSVLIEELTRS